MRDVKRKAEKKKSHLIGKQLQRTTTQDGNIKLIHFHLTILSSLPARFLGLLDRLFCASRLLLQNISVLFKYNENIK